VQDDTTQIRGDGAASASEDAHPATDLTEGVVHRITDIQPEKLAGIIIRIVVEGGSGDVRANLLDCLLIHIGMEDVCGLVCGCVVSRIWLPLITSVRAGLDERIHLYPVAIVRIVRSNSVVEARNLKVSHVVETTEGTLDTERSDKLTRGGIAEILSEFAVVTEQLAACFGAGDQTQNRSAVLLAKGIVPCTITDEANTKLVKLILCQLIDSRRNILEAGIFGVVARSNLADQAEILRAAAVVQNSLRQLGKLGDSLGDLVLNLEGGLQIVQADARGLIALRLEVPSADRLPKGEISGCRNATI